MTTDQAFKLALQYQHAGRFAEAEALYQRVLAAQPDHADALLHLGVVAYNTSRCELAADFLCRAVECRPDNPLAHANLGEAYRVLRRFQEARAACEHALQLRPNYPEAFGTLGLIFADLGRYEDAMVCYRQAIALHPADVDAYNNLGVALARQDRLEDAIASYQQAIQRKPDYAEALHNLGLAQARLRRFEDAIVSYGRALHHRPFYPDVCNNLGLALMERGRIDEALAIYERALQQRPDFAEVYNNIGVALGRLGRRDGAIAAYQRALELKPAYVDAQYNIGTILADLDRLDEATAAYRRTIELQPDHVDAFNNLGNALKEQRCFPEALACFHRALAARRDFADAHLNLGIALLHLMQYEEGWREYEWRLRCPATIGYVRHATARPWEGEDAEGRSIVVHAEQGFGDVVQFVRYLPLLCAQSRAARIVLECYGELVPSLSHLGTPPVEIVARGTLTGESAVFDFQVSLLSLPLKLQQYRPQAMDAPYLQPDPEFRARWRSRLAAPSCLQVGLAWAGNPNHINDRRRSIAPELLAPLLQIAGIQFVSLQVSPRSQIPRTGSAAELIDLSAEIGDFADSTALIAELDLIITVDTATAHLAGALGKPVWLLLPFVPDWRWGLEGEKTPWYPTMRLFRQPAAGDWASVIERVAQALRESNV